MTNKEEKKPLLIVISVLTIIVSLYLLYATVFDQMLSQSQGYFYAGVFAFILLLVFLLFNLFTKLIATSPQGQATTYWRIASIAILFVIAIVFLVFRLRLTSEIEASESIVYKSAVCMADGTYSQNTNLVEEELSNPAQYIYSLILSLIFKILGDSTGIYIITSAFIYVICGYLVFLITRFFADTLCALFAALLMALLPCQTFAVYSYNANPIASLLVLLSIYLIMYIYNHSSRALNEDDAKKDKNFIIILTVLAIVVSGLLFLSEPAYVISYIVVIIIAFISRKDHALNILIIFTAGLVLFALLSFAKSIHCGEDFGTVITKTIENFDFTYDAKDNRSNDFVDVLSDFQKTVAVQGENITDNYYYLIDGNGSKAYNEVSVSWLSIVNQLLYMFLLVMTCSCGIIGLILNRNKIIPLNSIYLTSVIVIFFQSGRDINKYSYISILVILTGISIHYLYLNHHPEQRVTLNAIEAIEKTGHSIHDSRTKEVVVNENMSDAEFLKRARALVFIGSDEELYKQIKIEEHQNAIRRPNNKINALEDTFDDYDEDFFLDKEDDNNEQIDNSKHINQETESETVIVGNSNVISGNDYYNNDESNIYSDKGFNSFESSNNDIGEVHFEDDSSNTVNTDNIDNSFDISSLDKDGDYSGNRSPYSSAIPVWKQQPERVGGDDMFFDEEDEELEKKIPEFSGVTTMAPEPFVEVVSRNSSGNDDRYGHYEANDSYIEDDSVNSQNEQEDSKNKLSFGKKNKEKKVKDIKVKDKKVKGNKSADNKVPKEAAKSSFTTNSSGRSIRKVKNIVDNTDDEVAKYYSEKANRDSMTFATDIQNPVEDIPNPLPIPVKKSHKEIDYDTKEGKSGWDYDYDIDDDSDWDV